MSSINLHVKALLLFGLAAVLSWLIYSSIEFYQENEKTPWSSEALSNPYLAAQYFLQQVGVEVKQAESLMTLDQLEGVSTVIITDVNQVANSRQLEKVLEWLEQGGNLIVAASSVSQEGDLLLDRFDVGVERYKEEKSDKSSADGESNKQKEKSLSDKMREYNEKIDQGMTPEEIAQSFSDDGVMTKVDFGDDIGVLEIAFNGQKVLTHPAFDSRSEDELESRPFSWSSSEHGVHMMQFEVGDGLLTVLSDPGIWTSRRIHQFDHAFLLWMLISRGGSIALFKPVDRPSLWALAVDSASEFLIALALLVLLLLWHLNHRFGRIEISDSVARRSLGVHFAATANYLWHRKATVHLLSPLRNKVMRSATLAYPAINRASSVDDKLQLISQYCEIDLKTLEKAFNSTQHNEITFVQTVRLLKQIENLL
jgi:hypothetical protein